MVKNFAEVKKIVILTNPNDFFSGNFIRNLFISKDKNIKFSIFEIKRKHFNFSLQKKIKYFFTYIGLRRVIENFYLSRIYYKLTPKYVADKKNYDYKIIEIEDLNKILEDSKADICVIASLGHILKKDILKIKDILFLNIHPSLLPAHAGSTPLFWTLYNRETVFGVTIHQLSESIDSGPILAQKSEQILKFNEFDCMLQSSKLAGKLFSFLILKSSKIFFKEQKGKRNYEPRPTLSQRRHLIKLLNK